jgi:hypothetical protein
LRNGAYHSEFCAGKKMVNPWNEAYHRLSNKTGLPISGIGNRHRRSHICNWVKPAA